MKRIRAEVEITRRTSVAFEVDGDLDDEEVKRIAIEEAELGEWEDDPCLSRKPEDINILDFFHIPSDLVVDRGASTVRGRLPRYFPCAPSSQLRH